MQKVNKFRFIVLTLVFIFLVFVGQANRYGVNASINEEETNDIQLVYIYVVINTPPEKVEETPSVITNNPSREFVITAYDNSPESQGKWVDQTASGFNLKGHSLESAKCVAVDPAVIPLGTKLELTFDDEYAHLNDVFIARDTGGDIEGEMLDLFVGDGVDKSVVKNFGRRKVQVRIIE